MALRLTQEIRGQIIKAAIAAKFDKRDAAYEKSRIVLADAIYKNACGAYERSARRLPAEWFNSENGICLSHDRYRWHGGTGVPDRYLTMSRSRPLPYHSHDVFKVDGNHPLNDMCNAVADECAAIAKDKDELRDKLHALLYSVQTAEKLHEVWPEGKRFFPSLPAKPSLPVSRNLTAQINQMLGLKAA